ncbi:MAG: hypothetical protein ACXWJW_04300 [Xanthobacteraceae bacterium]
MSGQATRTTGIRHHAGGSIDFDFYRTRATACRRQALRDATSVKSVCAILLVSFGALALTVAVAGKPLHTPDPAVALSCAGPVAAVAQPKKRFCALDQAEWQGHETSRLELGETP